MLMGICQVYKAFRLEISTLMGEGDSDWKAFWDSNPEWRSRDQRDTTGGKHFGEPIMPEGECRPYPILLSYTLAFALQLRKNHRKTSVRLAEKCQLGTIRFVNQAAVATVTDCSLQNPWLALQGDQVNPWSA
jgi:hypothetical protein